MNILILSAYFESRRGGVELVAGGMARAFTQRGHVATWAATTISAPPCDLPQVLPVDGWDPGMRRLGVPTPIPTPAALARLARAVGAADAVVLHDGLYLQNAFAFLVAKLRRKPVVLIQHIGSVPYKQALLRRAMEIGNALIVRPMLRHADQAVFISHATAAFFAGVRMRRPARVVFNGVDADAFRPAVAGEAAALRRAFGLDTNRAVILFVGRFVEKKGLATMRALAAAWPQHVFVLAGGGPIDPRAWGLPNVVVLRDLARADVARLYRAADLFVLPSRGEGYPLVIQEALASGLPLLCSDDIVAADPAIAAFADGVDAAAPDAVARFVERLPRALRRVGSGAQARRDHAVSRYPDNGLAAAVLDILQDDSIRARPSSGAASPLIFGAVSAACAGLNLLLLALGDAAALPYYASGAAAFVAVVVFGFLAHSLFTFDRKPTAARFLRYLGTLLMATPLHAGVLWLVCGLAGASALAGGLVSLVVLSLWNIGGVHWAMRSVPE